ncbi:hypothetical protein X798_07085, partial [Onchocerca flexuosa]
KKFQEAWEQFGNEGKRVIAFAIKHFFINDANAKFTSSDVVLENLIFLGMTALIDPPRDDAANAIKQCKEAGIKVYMITGDHPTTAAAVARKIGLIGIDDEMVEPSSRNHLKLSVTDANEINWGIAIGDDLDHMDENGWNELLKKKYIQKFRIVEECQKRGEIVAVTGQGVNDTQALACANIGIAMGIAASELPPSISLAYQLPENDIMRIPPRHRNDRLVSRPLLIYSYAFIGTIITAGCIISFLFVYQYHNVELTDLFFTADNYWCREAENYTISNGNVLTPSEQINIKGQAAAAWQITLVVSQVFHLYMCTTRGASFFRHPTANLVSIFAVVIEILLLNLFIYTPFAQFFLETQSPPNEVDFSFFLQ